MIEYRGFNTRFALDHFVILRECTVHEILLKGRCTKSLESNRGRRSVNDSNGIVKLIDTNSYENT